MQYDNIKIVVGGGDTATPLNMEKRIRIIEKFIIPGKTKFLDCGCGTGKYVEALSSRFNIDIYGIEYLEDKLNQAKLINPQLRIKKGDIEKIDFPDSYFDVVLLNEVLEHIPNEKKALNEIFRVLKTNGKLIIFSPNRLYPFESHGVYFKKSGKKIPSYTPLIPYIPIKIGKYIFNYWARNYWPWELRKMIELNGFKIIETGFVWQTFENISGEQPYLIRKMTKLFRFVSNCCEKIPLLKHFGVSQLIIAVKQE